jgi:hypothetical protein
MISNRWQACRIFGLAMITVALLSQTTFAEPPMQIDSLVSEYDDLAVKANALIEEFREVRKTGTVPDREKGLLLRREVGELMKKVRRYDREHALAATRRKVPYEDRPHVLNVLKACDQMQGTLEIEMKANDFLQLGMRYEQKWRDADLRLRESEPRWSASGRREVIDKQE